MINKQKGFTILELMIATSIFSIILLTGSVLIVQIGKMYYKGINYSRVQETTRNIIDDISRNAQLARDSIGGNTVLETGAVCVGNAKYNYNKNKAVVSGSGTVLSKTEYLGSCEYIEGEGQELLAENMRLTKFEVNEDGSLVTIKIQVLYASGGDDPTLPGNDLISETPGPDSTKQCTGDVTGSQWCAASYLTTIVFRRLPGGV